MIKLVLILLIGIISISCSTETIYNTTTTTTNNYYYGSTMTKGDTLFIVQPWIDKDTTIVIGG